MYIKSTYDGLHVITGTTENVSIDIHAAKNTFTMNKLFHSLLKGVSDTGCTNALLQPPPLLVWAKSKDVENSSSVKGIICC